MYCYICNILKKTIHTCLRKAVW